jgi:toxin ParE1/3/4
VTVRWTHLARQRLNEIVQHIAEDDPAAARRWSEGVFKRIENLKTFPRMGRTVPEVGKREIREVFHGDYRIIYKVRRKDVLMLTIRHGRRLFDRGEVDA